MVLLDCFDWGCVRGLWSTIVAETWIALILISAELPLRFKPAAQRLHLEAVVERTLHRDGRDAVRFP